MRDIWILALMVIAFASAALSETEIGDDGLHKADWMHQTFMDLREDQDGAEAEGKILMIIWEQRGCIYCDKMHEEVFTDPEIKAMLEDDYYVVQYNLFGDIEVTDFDGDVRSERDMAMKWGVIFTPSLMFFPEAPQGDESASELAAVTMPGAFGKWTTKNLLNWVKERGYEGSENFQKYHAVKIQEAREAGELPDE